jgi:hypothetical protein
MTRRIPMNPIGYNMNGCKGGCGCGGACKGTMNNLNGRRSIMRMNGTRMNGTFEDLMMNLTSSIGSGEPLTTVNLQFDNETLLKLGIGLLGAMVINEKIIKSKK